MTKSAFSETFLYKKLDQKQDTSAQTWIGWGKNKYKRYIWKRVLGKEQKKYVLILWSCFWLVGWCQTKKNKKQLCWFCFCQTNVLVFLNFLFC